MDPLLELVAKGGIGIVIAYIIFERLTAAVKTLFEKFEEHSKLQDSRCQDSNKLLVARVQELENRQFDQFTIMLKSHQETELVIARALNTNADALHIHARAFERQSETDKHRAIDYKERT